MVDPRPRCYHVIHQLYLKDGTPSDVQVVCLRSKDHEGDHSPKYDTLSADDLLRLNILWLDADPTLRRAYTLGRQDAECGRSESDPVVVAKVSGTPDAWELLDRQIRGQLLACVINDSASLGDLVVRACEGAPEPWVTRWTWGLELLRDVRERSARRWLSHHRAPGGDVTAPPTSVRTIR